MFISPSHYEKMRDVERELHDEVLTLTESNRQLGMQIKDLCKTIENLKIDKQLLLDKNFAFTRQTKELEETIDVLEIQNKRYRGSNIALKVKTHDLEQEVERLKCLKIGQCCRRICCKGE